MHMRSQDPAQARQALEYKECVICTTVAKNSLHMLPEHNASHVYALAYF